MDRSTLENVQQTQCGDVEFNAEHLENLLNHADSMLNMHPTEITMKYTDRTVLVIHCYEKGEMDEHIEVRFENEGADLTCNFDADKKCEGILIFPDQLGDWVYTYKNYVRYLNSRYMHIEGQFCWKMPQGVLTLVIDEKKAYLGYFRGLEVPQLNKPLNKFGY